MRKAVLIGIAAAAVAIAGCGRSHAEDAGPTVDRSYQVGTFDGIEIAGPVDVEVTSGAAPSVSASGPQKLIERMVVEVKDGKLRIHPEKERGFHWGGWGNSGKATFRVTAPSLREASIAGSGGLRIHEVKGDSFNGAVAGSGDLDIESLQVQSLKLAIGGSGDVRAAGQAKAAEYNIAGSGDIDAAGVNSQTASVSIAGSGNIAGHASGTADISIMGSGNVTMTGGAKCNVSKAGSGSIECS
ncbi:MAG TPA: head GIN domain-containing protein [Sphingomicrobium sp.]|nr:head GIN domain-containing protein [Sphingomicrobium sp.]